MIIDDFLPCMLRNAQYIAAQQQAAAMQNAYYSQLQAYPFQTYNYAKDHTFIGTPEEINEFRIKRQKYLEEWEEMTELLLSLPQNRPVEEKQVKRGEAKTRFFWQRWL